MYFKKTFIIVLAMLPLISFAKTPCDGLEQSLTEIEKANLAPVILKQLRPEKIIINENLPDTQKAAAAQLITNISKPETVDILESYLSDGWQMLLVDTHAYSISYLVFSGDPRSNHYIFLWNMKPGLVNEEYLNQMIRSSVKSIPDTLASCFAWRSSRVKP